MWKRASSKKDIGVFNANIQVLSSSSSSSEGGAKFKDLVHSCLPRTRLRFKVIGIRESTWCSQLRHIFWKMLNQKRQAPSTAQRCNKIQGCWVDHSCRDGSTGLLSGLEMAVEGHDAPLSSE